MTTTTENIVVSRIGKAPIALPKKVTVTIDGTHVTVKGPLGELQRDFVGVAFEMEEGEDGKVVHVRMQPGTPNAKAMHGLGRALLNNMVEGVSEGFKRELDLVGVGYRADAQGQSLNLSLGFSHPVVFELPAAIKAQVDKQTHITLTSIDKELVGQIAAKIRDLRPPEPYKGKGIRYTGERIIQKAGKSGKK
jgi:large subunit ribosomal protein L6